MKNSIDPDLGQQGFIITALQRKGSRFLWQINQVNMGFISLDTVLEYSLAKGQNLSLVQLQKILRSLWLRRLFDYSFHFLKVRARSVAEMQKYLQRKLYFLNKSLALDIEVDSQDLIAKVIQKLINTDYLNDRTFVKNWLQSKLRQGKLGKTRIVMELKKLGISQDLINDIFLEKKDTFDKKQEQSLDQMLEKFFLRFKNKGLSSQKLKQKLLQRLVYRGFDYRQVAKKIDVLLDKM